jgi:plastocyanin
MLIHLLGALLALFSPASPVVGGSVSGRVVLVNGGTPRGEASEAAVWIEGLRRPDEVPGTVRGEMKSQRKKFTPRVLVVPQREAVEFPNVDPIYHNVFSVSGANRFDLGLYRSGASKTKRFDEPGLVRVYCNIHPTMVGFVMVVDSDYQAVTGPDGRFRFDGVPPGNYQLKVWHEEGGEASTPVRVRAGADAPIDLTLDVSGYRPQPHKNKYGKEYPPPPPDDERY